MAVRTSLLLSCGLLLACGRGQAAQDAGVQADGGDVDAGVECQASCSVAFRYPLEAGVDSVELRGNFGADPWNSGRSLERQGDEWVAELELEDGQFVEYKFVLNGSEWVIDPDNQSRIPDEGGTLNSAVQADCGCRQEAFDWRDGIMYFAFLDRFYDGDASNNSSVSGVPYEAN